MDWEGLQTFLAVANRGSVARAAKYLGVNHSTVLRRLRALEGELGTRLFDRLREGYALTGAGSALAARLRGLEEQVEAAQRRALGLDEDIQGRVRITASDVVVEGMLVEALASFRRRHPGVVLDVVSGYGFAALTGAEADLAVRGADEAPPGLVARHVGDIETVVCASHAYLSGREGDTPVEAMDWVGLDESLGFQALREWLGRNVPADRIVARIDSIAGVADALAGGLGVGLVPRPLLRARPTLVELAPPEPALRKPIWVLMHPELRHVARMAALMRHLVVQLRADPRLAHDGAGVRPGPPPGSARR